MVSVVVTAIGQACPSHDWVVDWDMLTEPQRAVCVADLFMSELYNGGLIQFYDNSSGDVAVHTPWALRTVGAAGFADLVDRANALFAAEALPVRPSRQKAVGEVATRLNALEAELYSLEDSGFDIWESLLMYIELHSDTFFA
jgi:Domain of unknown function (DUF4375)